VTEHHYLVLARDFAAQRRVVSSIRSTGGVVLLALRSGAVIARMSDDIKNEIAASNDVRHCGAIEVSPRPIRRIRVGPDGTRITA
jgi:hypothetical protein